MVIKFDPIHLNNLKVHKWMDFMNGNLTQEYGESLAKFPSYTYIRDNRVIACAGVFPMGKNRYKAWALISKDSGKFMLGVLREIRRFLDIFEADRVETCLVVNFPQGSKMLEKLGFVCETPKPMRKYGDDGKDYYLYARVND